MKDKDRNISSQSKGGEYARLEDLIAGKTPVHSRKNVVCFALAAVLVVALHIWYINKYPSSYYRQMGNPIIKIALKIDTKNYLENNYPEVADNMTVDINKDIIFHTNGYMVICRDIKNNHSTITIYYDKDMDVAYDVPQLKNSV